MQGLCAIFEETLCSVQAGPTIAKIENGATIIEGGCGETLAKSCRVQPLLFALLSSLCRSD